MSNLGYLQSVLRTAISDVGGQKKRAEGRKGSQLLTVNCWWKLALKMQSNIRCLPCIYGVQEANDRKLITVANCRLSIFSNYETPQKIKFHNRYIFIGNSHTRPLWRLYPQLDFFRGFTSETTLFNAFLSTSRSSRFSHISRRVIFRVPFRID